jgi:haloalkane dehalogenase
MTDPLKIKLPTEIAREYPFPRRSVQVDWGMMHTVDTGGEGRTVLMIHGNPTWSFLYRKIMDRMQGTGLRMIAPDLIGLGLSHKPADWRAHSLRKHGESLLQFVEALDLRNIILVVQDWGGPVGGWMAAHAPERVTGLLVMNTSLLAPNRFKTTPFHRFSHLPVVSDLVFRELRFPIPVMDRVQGDPKSISKAAAKAYLWPLDARKDRAAPLALARMVPNAPAHPTVAELKGIDQWVRSFKGPAELIWGLRDPILGRLLKRHREALPHARVTETQAGHFLQEEVPDEIAQAIRRLAAGE